MAEKTCIFTGHRVIPRNRVEKVMQQLDRGVAWAYAQGYTVFLSGGAMGFDRMAAEAVLRAKKEHPDVQLGILVPCRDQDAKWQEHEKIDYHRQLAAADDVEVLSEQYYDGCMQARNRALVARADVCIAYVTNPYSGASQTASMARKKGIPVYNLATEE